MNVINLTNPFPHVIIKDFYSDEEMKLIQQEFKFLNQPGKLMDNTKIGDTPAPDHKSGLYLDEVYPHRAMSNILTINRKIFDQAHVIEDYVLRHQLNAVHQDFTWICYYYDGTYYGAHPDLCMLTAVSVFHAEPKCFQGGDLRFTRHDYTAPMWNNSIILFHSFEPHEVTTVRVTPSAQKQGLSRWSMNQFMFPRPPR